MAALRGHEVTLVERSSELGGLLHAAGAPEFKRDIARLLAFKQREIRGLPSLTIQLNTEATAESIAEHAPDVVVVATGSRCLEATDVGLECDPDATVLSPHDVLQDIVDVPAGGVVIIGGGSVGCEVGLHLAMMQRSVTIIEQLAEAAADLHEANRRMLLELLERHGVRIETETKARRVTRGEVHTDRGRRSADAVVLAVGSQPVNELAERARTLAPEVLVVGDCHSPGTIQEAVWSAFKQARIL